MSTLNLPLWLMALTGVVAADTLRVLYNGRGETPCCVAQQLVAPCQSPVLQDCDKPMRDTDVNLGSVCTCNTVVFNLWSGCLETRNATIPNFNTWVASCQVNMTDITYNDYPLHDSAREVDIPTWAYINLSKDSNFDLGVALRKSRGWTTTQVILPITSGMLILGALGALYFFYRRRMRKLERDKITGNTWWTALHSSRSLLGTQSSAQARSSNRYRKSWTIDDFETARRRQSVDSEDDQHGYEWLTPAPPSQSPKHLSQKSQRYIQSFNNFWKNPFKKQPVQVVSLQPHRGFLVDGSDVSTHAANSKRPTLEPYDDLGNGAANQSMSNWSTVNGEEIFDARDDVLDENSVLLISRAPGVDPSMTSPTTDTNIIPTPPLRPNELPGALHTAPLTEPHPGQALPRPNPNFSVENILRPARTDPIMLIPASVRAAGYVGVPTPFVNHSITSPNSMPFGAP